MKNNFSKISMYFFLSFAMVVSFGTMEMQGANINAMSETKNVTDETQNKRENKKNQKNKQQKNPVTAGWFTDKDGTTCYYDETGNTAKGMVQINSDYYCFGNEGTMLTGFQIVNDNTYYFDTDGKMKTGWIDYGGEKYYFNSDGRMQNCRAEIDGKYAFFDKNGEYKGELFTGANEAAKDENKITSFGGYIPSDAVLQQLQTETNNIIKTGKNIGYLMIDINTQSGIAYNADKMFYSASTIKGPYITSILSDDQNALNVLNTDGIAMQNAIVKSSNNDYLDLRKKYGKTTLDKYLEKAGLRSDISDKNYTDISPRELAKLWLCNWDFFEKSPVAPNVAEWYNGVEVSAIKKVLGNNYTTYSKAGWISDNTYSATNDAGIVYDGDSPYIICVMSDIPGNDSTSFDKITGLVSAIDTVHKEVRG